MKVGDPVDLSDLVAEPRSHDVIAEATDRIMTALTEIVADLRGETPPAERFDPRKMGVREIGNPKQTGKRTSKRIRKGGH